MRYILLFLCLALMGQAQAQTKLRLPWRTVTASPGSPTPASSSNVITVTVTYASAPTSPTVTVAPLKYNKLAFFSYERDDAISTSSYGILHDYAFMNGGTDPSGNTYPGKTFTDGCGNNVKWRAGVAVNARSNGNYSLILGTSGKLTADQLATLASNKWGILNHGYYHELDSINDAGNRVGQQGSIKFMPPRATATFSKAGWSIAQNASFIDSILTTRGVRYITRVVVRPSAWVGYVRAADSLKYLGVTSTGTVETDYPNYPSNVALSAGGTSTNFVWIENLPLTGYSKFNNNGFIQLVRLFPADPWSASTTTTLKAQVADMMSKATTGKHLGMRSATHVNTAASFQEVFNYMDSLSQDRVWVVGMHEEREYQEVRSRATISRTISGNTVTFSIDMSAIPAINRFRDISLIAGGGTITNVTASGPHDRITYNTSTGLINIFWEKTTGFPSP